MGFVDKIGAFLTEAWSYFTNLISLVTFSDMIDIAVVSVILYYLFKFIRDRRAGKLAGGVVFLVILQIISETFDFMALQFLLTNVFQVGFIALIVVFQPELRSALEKMGGEPLRGLMSIKEQKDNQAEMNMINDLCEALCDLSRDKTGALVVIERSTKLGDVIKIGTVINADMSPFLLKNIFFNKAPLHDGAVVIRGGRIYAAGCILPLSTNDDIIKDLGTRHRAAIGMSENSDAVVLVVSEETGMISVAAEGQLKRNFDYPSLHQELEQMLIDNGGRLKSVLKRKDRTPDKASDIPADKTSSEDSGGEDRRDDQ